VLTGNLLDRCLDVASQGGLVLLGLLLAPKLDVVPDELEASWRMLFVAVAAALIVLLGVMFSLRKRILAGRSVRFRRRLGAAPHALRSVSKRPRVLVLGWLMGTSVSDFVSAAHSAAREYCGLKLPLSVWLFAWPLSKVGRSAATGRREDWIAGSGAGCVAFAAWGARAFGAGGRAGVGSCGYCGWAESRAWWHWCAQARGTSPGHSRYVSLLLGPLTWAILEPKIKIPSCKSIVSKAVLSGLQICRAGVCMTCPHVTGRTPTNLQTGEDSLRHNGLTGRDFYLGL